jgi:hypothetical protein
MMHAAMRPDAAGAVAVLTKPYKLPTIVSTVLQFCPRPLGD